MVRVFGASFERVEIKDLGDVIYYQQFKDYTDQQFESSKDLKMQIKKGRITVLKKISSPNTNSPVNLGGSTDVEEIKKVVESSMSSMKNSLKNSIRDIVPLIVDMVRQELDKIPLRTVVAQPSSSSSSTFVGPEYIPEVKTDDLVSNIEVDDREVSGDTVSDNLSALRKLKKSNKG